MNAIKNITIGHTERLYKPVGYTMLANLVNIIPFCLSIEAVRIIFAAFDGSGRPLDTARLWSFFEEMMGYLKRISRDNARTPMQWDDSANAGFTTGTPWIKVNSNYPKVNAKQEVSDPDSVFSYYKKLIRLRHENEIIVYGDYELLAPEDEALFIYTRMLGTQRLMVLCNFTEKEVAIPQEVTEQIPADVKLLIGNYSKQKEEMLQAYEARVYAYHL